ncbi:hypothetical protein GCM10027570_51410 [Streptomonospora sediminis]
MAARSDISLRHPCGRYRPQGASAAAPAPLRRYTLPVRAQRRAGGAGYPGESRAAGPGALSVR